MSRRPRRNHSAAFKAKGAIEALPEGKTIAEIASKHAGLGKVTLFVLGHTDTVGSDESNLALSRKRARAIAAWFKGHGLGIAIAVDALFFAVGGVLVWLLPETKGAEL